ncbi:THO complex subunit 5B [Tanacetum coccineum]
MLLDLEIFYFISAETKKSERKARAQVTPTETDGVVITEVDMGDTSGLTVRATVVQTSTIFCDTHVTLGLPHFLCYQSVLARVLLVEKVVRNAEAKEAQLDREKEHILSRKIFELPQQSGDGLIFDERRSARLYKWAQHLAGIDFLPYVLLLLTLDGESTNGETTKQTAIISELSLYRRQNRVQTVVQRIRARKKAQLALAEQIDSLAKLKWTALNCITVLWFSYDRLCNLQSWTIMLSHKATTSIEENIQAPQEVEMVNEPDTSKVEIENNREDGELPSLNPVTTIVKDIIITPLKESGIEHSRRLALITKFVASPRSKGKSVKLPSFRKHDDDLDLMLVFDSEVDKPTETDEATWSEEIKVVDNSWITCGIQEYSLLLTRKVNSGYGHMNLEAKRKSAPGPEDFSESFSNRDESSGEESLVSGGSNSNSLVSYDKKRLRRKEKELLHFAATAASMSAQPKGNTFVEKGTQNHCATDYCVQTQAEQAQRQP